MPRVYLGTRTVRNTVDGKLASSTSQEFSLNFTDLKSGDQNPKWRSQVKKHINASTPYSCDRFKLEQYQTGAITITDENLPFGPTNVTRISGPVMTSITLPNLGSSGSVKAAATLAWSRKARRAMTSIRGPTFLGEIRKTLRMIRHPAQALQEGFRTYLNVLPKKVRTHWRKSLKGTVNVDLPPRGLIVFGQKAGFTKASRSLAEAYRKQAREKRGKTSPNDGRLYVEAIASGLYLENANGWRPLLADIDGGMKALADFMVKNGTQYKKVTATSSGETVTVLNDPYTQASLSGVAWYQRRVERREASCRIVGEVKIVNDGSRVSFNRGFGFGWDQWAPTLWQLLPLSYVADYFLNIEDYLDLATFDRSSVSWACPTVRRRSVLTQIGAPKPNNWPAGFVTSCNPGRVQIIRTGLTRAENVDFTASLTSMLPDTFLASKFLNVASLLIQSRATSQTLARYLQA